MSDVKFVTALDWDKDTLWELYTSTESNCDEEKTANSFGVDEHACWLFFDEWDNWITDQLVSAYGWEYPDVARLKYLDSKDALWSFYAECCDKSDLPITDPVKLQKKIGWSLATLWELRREIKVFSFFYSHFRNSFGVDEYDCADFFDGYTAFLDELMTEDDAITDDLDYFELFADYDTADNLWRWYCCFDTDPLPCKK